MAEDDFLNKLLAEPAPRRLTPEEFARLHAYLKRPIVLSQLQTDPESREARIRLKEVYAYNRALGVKLPSEGFPAPPRDAAGAPTQPLPDTPDRACGLLARSCGLCGAHAPEQGQRRPGVRSPAGG